MTRVENELDMAELAYRCNTAETVTGRSGELHPNDLTHRREVEREAPLYLSGVGDQDTQSFIGVEIHVKDGAIVENPGSYTDVLA